MLKKTALMAAAGTLLVSCSWSPSSPPQALEHTDPVKRLVSQEDGNLTAGFASVDMTWRAGSKPGQVGTESTLFEMARLWGGIIKLIVYALPQQRLDNATAVLQAEADYTVDHVNSRLDEIFYDRYTDVYQPGRGMHTHSYAKAMVLENNGVKVAVVRADLYLMQKTLWRKVAALVSEETGIPAENILIAATHNHSAADAAFTAAGISTIAENFDPRHFVWVSHAIANAIRQADAARVPARLTAIESTLRATQRNIIGPSTTELIPPDGYEAQTVQVGYPRDYFDDALFLLDFHSAETNERLGVYTVYGTHPESLEDGHGLLSSDFAGQLELGLEARFGGVVMWSPGALGDIEQDDGTNFGTDFWREDFSRLEEQAATLIDAIAPKLQGELSVEDRVVDMGRNVPLAARTRVFPGARNTNYPGRTPWMIPVTEYLSEDLPVTCPYVLTESDNVLLQTLRLGDVLLLGSPSEVTTDMALHIRSRVDNVEGNLYQGYVWPDAEAWVEEEINQNFDNSELSADEGFAMPIVLSQVNDYLGYMVTRWEFNNRTHYRQSMTLFGEDTANYVAGRFEGLARELRGQAPEVLEWDEPSELGVTLEDDIYATVSDLEPWVTSWASEIPADNAQQMGRILSDVEVVNDDEMGAQAVHFSWQGGTSDLPIPSVRVERQSSSGTWSLVMDDVHPHVWVLYEKGGKWEAVWHWKDAPEPGTYRIRVEGLYRGASDGTSTPDPLWDPSGRNVPYQVVSGELAVQ